MAEVSDPDGLGSLFADAMRLVRARVGLFAVVVAVATAAGAGVDLMPPETVAGTTFLLALLNLYLQMVLTRSVLDLDRRRETGPGYASVVGLAFLYGSAVLIGLLLLLIPGVILILRWSVSLPVLLAEDCGISGSLARSWELTRGRWWLVIGVQTVGLLNYGLVIFLFGFAAYPDEWPSWTSLPVNLWFSLLQAFLWVLAVALYRRLSEVVPPQSLPEIFR